MLGMLEQVIASLHYTDPASDLRPFLCHKGAGEAINDAGSIRYTHFKFWLEQSQSVAALINRSDV